MSAILQLTRLAIKLKRPEFEFAEYQDSPIAPLEKPLNKCSLALVTTGGLHMQSDPPFDFSMKEGDTSYRIIPTEADPAEIRISHNWYNHKFINADINCVFPIDRMKEYLNDGTIGSLSKEHYSFMGHIYDTEALIKRASYLGRHMKDSGVDIAFLTPT
ncbi:hypothetical protein H8E50_05750 [bacterium]|nr:hypothetical protein [bacterium]